MTGVLEGKFAEALVRTMQDPVLVLDRKGIILKMNSAIVKLFGYGKKEATDKHFLELSYERASLPKELKRVKRDFNSAVKEGRSITLEYEYITKKGKSLHVSFISSILKDSKQNTFNVIAIFRNITERKKAEDAMQIQNRIANVFLTVSEEGMYNDVLNIFLDALDSKFGVFGFIDEDGALVVPSMTRHIWSECEVAEKRIVFPRDTWGKSTWPRCIQEKRPIYMNESSTITPEGHITIERHISMPIIHQDEVIGLFQVANKDTDYTEEDIKTLEGIARYVAPILHARLRRKWSERDRLIAEGNLKESEKELRILNERLEERVEERTSQLQEAQEKIVRQERLATLGKLSGGIGHELRNPLGAIKNAVFYLRMDIENPDEDMAATLDALDKDVGTCERIISSLLGYARPQAPTLQKTALDEVIGEALSGLTIPDNVDIVQKYPKELQLILADPVQMNQICVNLILNAIQAMPEGGIITITLESPNSDWMELSIADTGVGIASENMNQLFEPLFTTKAKGIGLGLAIIKTMIEGHGGRIDVQSEAGRGSTFTVNLPSKMIKQT